MSKLLLGVLVLLAVVWLLRGSRRGREAARRDMAPPQAVQAMVRCAHCGVHLPQTDAVEHAGRAYCSMLHRLAGPRAPHGSR